MTPPQVEGAIASPALSANSSATADGQAASARSAAVPEVSAPLTGPLRFTMPTPSSARAVTAPASNASSVAPALRVEAPASPPALRIVPPPAAVQPLAPAAVPIATSAEGCASGECLPEAAVDAQEADEAADAIEAAAKPVLSAAERWKGAVEVIRSANARLGKSLSFARLVSLGAGDARLAFPTDAGFHRATVFGHARAELEAVLTQHLGEKIKLAEEKSEAAYQAANRSVAETEAHAKVTRERDIEQKVRENPAVLSVMRMFGGTLEHVQVLDANAAPRDEAVPSPDDEPQ